MAEPYYITTPIYYVNDKPHIGHVYTTVACDVLARFKRLDGFDVKFLTGTDEHGLKVKQEADKAGVDPQEFTDKVSQNFRDLSELMNYSNDDFIRTTEERHKKAAQGLWKRLVDKGEIYLDKYSGWYAVRDEAYYNEDELTDHKGTIDCCSPFLSSNARSTVSKSGCPPEATCEKIRLSGEMYKLSGFSDGKSSPNSPPVSSSLSLRLSRYLVKRKAIVALPIPSGPAKIMACGILPLSIISSRFCSTSLCPIHSDISREGSSSLPRSAISSFSTKSSNIFYYPCHPRVNGDLIAYYY